MIKIVALALLFSIIILYLKNINSELTILATVGAGLIILSFSLDYITETISVVNKMIELSGVNKSFFKIIFKATAVAYLVEFTAGTIADFGLNSLSDKLYFVGKLIILSLSLPIFYAVFNLLTEILQWEKNF